MGRQLQKTNYKGITRNTASYQPIRSRVLQVTTPPLQTKKLSNSKTVLGIGAGVLIILTLIIIYASTHASAESVMLSFQPGSGSYSIDQSTQKLNTIDFGNTDS